MPNTTQIRIGLMIASAVVIVTAAFFFAEYRNKKSEKLAYSSVVASTTDIIVSKSEELDTDGDGLKDWEEILLGTDVRNPDTDKDGTPDGKEVALGRNPLVKGLNDSNKVITGTGAKKEQLAPIDLFARNFFARYMELKQAGVSGDKASQEELASAVIKEGIVLSLPKTYEMKSILISTDTSNDYIKKYASEVNSIFFNNQNKGRDESAIAKESLEKDNPELLKEIDPIIAIYKNVIASLLKVKAPQSLAQTHLDLVNAMSGFLFVAESLRKTDKDALVALQGASRQLDAGKALNAALIKIRSYLN